MTDERLRRRLLTELYGISRADAVAERIEQSLARHQSNGAATTSPWSEPDAWLITYADQFQTETEPPLRTLDRFLY